MENKKMTEIVLSKKSKIGFVKMAKILTISFLIGAIVGFVVLQAYEITDKKITGNFLEILLNNIIVITIIYIAMLFLKGYIYFIYILNGFALGMYVGIALKLNMKLIFLILPQGVFEVLFLLLPTIWLEYEEVYIRQNIRNYLKYYLINIILITVCAVFENYITPIIYMILQKS